MKCSESNSKARKRMVNTQNEENMMMKKVLYISNIAGKKVSLNFFGSALNAAKELGMDFYVVANRSSSTKEQIAADEKEYGVHLLHADISRSPFSMSNYKAYKQIVEMIKEHGIDYIHCNTPVGGLLGRLAGKKCGVKRVIYQAHGFHFYKGAPKKNWLLYYPVEKWLAHYTDALIIINNEDYELAKSKLKLRNKGKVYYVPGVGIDPSQYNSVNVSRNDKRRELGLNDDDIALISMGDLIERKNYDTSIRAIAEAQNDKLHYFICGKGPEEDNLRTLAQDLNVSDQIHFLGFRSDIKELLVACDIFLFTTKQEGLPRSLSEAMASGLPCIASNIRGNTDLLEDAEGGFLCTPTDVKMVAEKINILASDSNLRSRMGKNNLITIQKFSTETVTSDIQKIYEMEITGKYRGGNP